MKIHRKNLLLLSVDIGIYYVLFYKLAFSNSYCIVIAFRGKIEENLFIKKCYSL